ncbi:NAD-dependent deacylase [Sphingobacterium alkalisoli]|uniref:NAD-dependent protein deacylase n=1 Tax=Sphingobacterium alkalisoli TaxID=1874115 RepID=A0A4U0H200_9SPHI|nr:Sir2 family NAD-dependent protein deacetylase [Sphingobacterium alkalisoli]TJY65613.1 NAD-dependent deacylase [Sphingobacterium alkalisoli]GGH19409.1 NAD-dependent protein deacylase [Sphingobacterium alkalisoli]
MKKKVVVFTGAGISVDSGLQTFRGDDGLWEGYNLEEVATPQAWIRNPELVQRFYNERRSICRRAKPNAAHKALVALEEQYDVAIITQNIDDLHERAGSSYVLHLHGEIMKAQSTKNPNLIYPIHSDNLEMGQLCELGTQLRPHVVWFGESVPNMAPAIEATSIADIFIVVGTSLQVYPAANLLYETAVSCEIIVIDPNANNFKVPSNTRVIRDTATAGLSALVESMTK